ncbi:MAG: sel1 repeat family protein [Rhodobacteraceae bacterium]|nr:MAG: sel1 repeat family protein [Paracoccaceae bacterium]
MASFRLAALMLMFAASGEAALAQDLSRGNEAYRSGDYATAIREWLPLAERGEASAQFNLGVAYSKGRGVPQDFTLAYMWFDIATSLGFEKSEINRDLVALAMTPEEISKGQQLARECIAKNYKGC